MTESWIGLSVAIERVRSHQALAQTQARLALVNALAAGEVRSRWDGFVGERGAYAGTNPPIARHAWVGATISAPDRMESADGKGRQGISVSEADLASWLGEPRFTRDEVLFQEGAKGVKSGKWKNQSEAARALASRAKGASPEAICDRLARGIGRILGKADTDFGE